MSPFTLLIIGLMFHVQDTFSCSAQFDLDVLLGEISNQLLIKETVGIDLLTILLCQQLIALQRFAQRFALCIYAHCNSRQLY